MPIYQGNKLVSDIKGISDGFVGLTRVYGIGQDTSFVDVAIDPTTLNPNIWFDSIQSTVNVGGSGGITGVSNLGSDFATFNSWPADNPSFTNFKLISGSVSFGRMGSRASNHIWSLFREAEVSELKTVISIARKNANASGLTPEGSYWAHTEGDGTSQGFYHTTDDNQTGNTTCDLGVGGQGSGGGNETELETGFPAYVVGEEPFTFFSARSNDYEAALRPNQSGSVVYEIETGFGYKNYVNPIDAGNNGATWPQVPNSFGFPYGEDITSPTIGGAFDYAAILGFDYVLTRQQVTGIYAYYASLGYNMKS